MNDDGKIAFTKTEEVNTENAPRFKVTLGVVPDYLYDGKGMRIDGITEGKPAANAGCESGRCGDEASVTMEVNDMMGYMKALGAVQEGRHGPGEGAARQGQGGDIDTYESSPSDERHQRIAVIGAGSWGTALVKLLIRQSHDRWAGGCASEPPSSTSASTGTTRTTSARPSSTCQRLAMDSDIHAVVKNADVLVIAVPSAFLKACHGPVGPG